MYYSKITINQLNTKLLILLAIRVPSLPTAFEVFLIGIGVELTLGEW